MKICCLRRGKTTRKRIHFPVVFFAGDLPPGSNPGLFTIGTAQLTGRGFRGELVLQTPDAKAVGLHRAIVQRKIAGTIG